MPGDPHSRLVRLGMAASEMTYKEVGRAIGRSHQYAHQLAHGYVSPPRLATALALARTFGMPEEQFVVAALYARHSREILQAMRILRSIGVDCSVLLDANGDMIPPNHARCCNCGKTKPRRGTVLEFILTGG